MRGRNDKGQLTNSFSKPLSNLTVMITRTKVGNKIERDKLEYCGAEVVELDAIRVMPPTSWKRLDKAIEQIEEFDWIVFTSSNAIQSFFRRCAEKGKKKFFDALKQRSTQWPKFACVGPSTRKSLESHGYVCSLEPKEFLTRNLGRELGKLVNQDHNNILLARAEEASREISTILKHSGATICEAPVYRTEPTRKTISKAALDRVTDVTLTSPSTVNGLLKSVTINMISSRSIRVHCIGPVTATAARQKGLRVSTVAKTHTIDGLIDSLVGYKSSHNIGSGVS